MPSGDIGGRLQKMTPHLVLLDPTDGIREGCGDSWVELDLAKRHNHFLQGYIFSDMKGLQQKSGLLAVSYLEK